MYEVYLKPIEIQAALMIKGDSLTKIAQRCGYNPMTAFRVARGEGRTPAIRNEIARVLNRPLESIFGPRIPRPSKNNEAPESKSEASNSARS